MKVSHVGPRFQLLPNHSLLSVLVVETLFVILLDIPSVVFICRHMDDLCSACTLLFRPVNNIHPVLSNRKSSYISPVVWVHQIWLIAASSILDVWNNIKGTTFSVWGVLIIFVMYCSLSLALRLESSASLIHPKPFINILFIQSPLEVRYWMWHDELANSFHDHFYMYLIIQLTSASQRKLNKQN